MCFSLFLLLIYTYNSLSLSNITQPHLRQVQMGLSLYIGMRGVYFTSTLTIVPSLIWRILRPFCMVVMRMPLAL